MEPGAFGWLRALALTLSLVCAPSFAQETEREVPFLTLRNPGGPDGPSPYFGDERSGLRAGLCRLRDVDIGGLEPIVGAVPSFMREQLLRVDSVRIMEPGDLLDGLQDKASTPALFVHGYFIDFEKGCRRAALLQENARLDSRLLWFSWPSDGDIANYTRDEADLYWSVPDLASAIIDLDSRTGAADALDVLGHSLGARGVVLALHEVAYLRPDIRLGNVVLLAPDMDFEIFAKLLPRIAQITENISIYTSDEDHPLALSAQLHGYARLGQSGNDVGSLFGVEIIDLSAVPNESPSGHLYHIHNTRVGDDLDLLLNSRLPAAQRPNLLQTGPNSWSIRE